MVALVTVDDYQSAIQTDLDAGATVAAIFELDAASEDVRDYLHQQIDYIENDTVVIHGTGTKALLLPELPVVSVAEVLIDDETVTDYTVDLVGGILYRNAWGKYWPAGFHNVTVTYTHGYVEVPANIQRAVIELAKLGYHQATRAPGISSETIGPFSVTYTQSNDQGEHDRIIGTLQRRQVRRQPVM